MKLDLSIVIPFIGDKDLSEFACNSMSESVCNMYDLPQHKEKLTLILINVRKRLKLNQEAVVYISFDDPELIFKKLVIKKLFDFRVFDFDKRLN